MRPNPFPIARDNLQAYFGSNPIRFWSFSEAPQKPDPATGYPYAVWQHVIGIPYNSLNCSPSLWQNTVQIDIYDENISRLVQATEATVAAFADAGMIGNTRDWPREAQTRLYRYTIEVDLN